MSACLLNLGSLDCDRKCYDTARDWIEQALDLARNTGDLVGAANCLNNLGVVLIELKEHLQAARNLEEARQLYEKAGVTSGVAFCKYNMGLIYFERAEMERATGYLLESLDLRISAGDRRGVVESLELACAAAASVLPPGVLSTLVAATSNGRDKLHMPRSDRRTDELTTLAVVELRAADPDYYANVLHGNGLTLEEAVDLFKAHLRNDSPILKY
jgi:tetratricopeptide (TPR) repeat protein